MPLDTPRNDATSMPSNALLLLRKYGLDQITRANSFQQSRFVLKQKLYSSGFDVRQNQQSEIQIQKNGVQESQFARSVFNEEIEHTVVLYDQLGA